MIAACRAWIEAALAYSGGTHTFEDVAAGIESGRMQLWPADDGCIVTEIQVFPRKLVLNFFLAGGDLARLLDMVADVEEWARGQGCTAAEMTGRKGWERVLAARGYRFSAVTIGKEL